MHGTIATLATPPAPFQGLVPFGYDLTMADPPWPTKMRSPSGEKKSPARHYGMMSFAQIAALPVGAIAARPSALFLWCCWPHLFYGGDIKRHFRDHDASRTPVGEVIKAWGYRYVTGGAWFKRTSTGKPAFGPGYRVRSTCEPFLLAIKGSPKNSRSARNIIEGLEHIVENAFDGLRREHSRKPDEAFKWCEDYLPGARRVELFSRQSRPGWDTWGYEAGKFDPVVTHGAIAA